MIQEATTKKMKTIPGPKATPFLGNFSLMKEVGHTYETYLSLHKEYGDIFRLALPGGGTAYVLAGADMLQHVLQMNNSNYRKGERFKIAEPLIGKGLFISEGDFWRRQRRMMQPAFHRKQIALLVEEMVNTTAEMLDRWQAYADSGQTLDIQKEMMGLTMEIVTRTLFTNSLTSEEVIAVGESLTFLLEVISERGNEIIPIGQKLPTRKNRKFDQSIQELNELIYRLIDERRASGENGDDLLGMLLDARDDDGQGMNHLQLRDELITMFLAGHETTAIALSWAFAHLSQSPEVRRRLNEEVDNVLAGDLPTAADYARLPYAQAVFQESLRLYPPLPLTMRESIEDDEIDGYHIPVGSLIFVNFYANHHNPDHWTNPEGFDPDRFLPENSKGRHRFAFLPFSGGPRQCIGNNFALMEGAVVLAMVAQRFELDLVSGTRIAPHMIGTLRPEGGVPVTVCRR